MNGNPSSDDTGMTPIREFVMKQPVYERMSSGMMMVSSISSSSRRNPLTVPGSRPHSERGVDILPPSVKKMLVVAPSQTSPRELRNRASSKPSAFALRFSMMESQHPRLLMKVNGDVSFLLMRDVLRENPRS